MRLEYSWTLLLTLLLALLLSVAPLPEFMEKGRPLWLALALSYWVLHCPHRVGLATAWMLGLAEDVLYGTVLGQNAFILVLVCVLMRLLEPRFRVAAMWQQCVMVLVVMGVSQLVQLWLLALTSTPPPVAPFMLPALVSALLWPWVCVALRAWQKRMRIY